MTQAKFILLSRAAETVHFTAELGTAFWSSLLARIFRTLVQAYAEASRKKCSNEGRALMLLDFEHLSRELEAITGIKPLPGKAYLENYIKAFFLPRETLDTWIVEHTVSNFSNCR